MRAASSMFVDCNREDLCMSFEDFERKAEEHRPRAAMLVHIGGHVAFDVREDRRVLPDRGDLPARGLRPRPRRRVGTADAPGPWGDAGAYSFYATKTISTGEGGMLVSADDDLLEFARLFRNYGKPDHRVEGLNFRMNEFTAAIGLVQTERLEEIVAARTPSPASSSTPCTALGSSSRTG